MFENVPILSIFAIFETYFHQNKATLLTFVTCFRNFDIDTTCFKKKNYPHMRAWRDMDENDLHVLHFLHISEAIILESPHYKFCKIIFMGRLYVQ